jgi:hypothetical protein
MKKLIPFILLLIAIGCSQDEPFVDEISIEIPKSLEINDTVGMKTESIIVEEEVNINVKLPYSGQYRIKIRDIAGTLISQELIIAKTGNNLLKVYVSTLPKSSYRLELTDNEHKVIGAETIVVN